MKNTKRNSQIGMTLASNAQVHAEHNLYTFACDVVCRYPKDIALNYWELYEGLTERLSSVLSELDEPSEVFACYSSSKGHRASLLGLMVVAQGCDLGTATVTELLKEMIPSIVDGMSVHLSDADFTFEACAYVAQTVAGRLSLLCQPVLRFDGVSVTPYVQARPTKRNVHVAIDEDIVRECMRAALPIELSTAMEEAFGIAA